MLLVCSQSILFAQYFNDADKFLYNCDGIDLLVSLQNTDPSMDVNAISQVGLVAPTFTYNQTTGEIDINLQGLMGPESYGFYEFELVDGGGSVLETFTVYILDCCLQPIKPDYIVVEDDASTMPYGQYLSSLKILILDHLNIDINLTLDNSTFYFGAEAKATLQPSLELEILESTLKEACEYRWDGVFAEGENSSILIQSSTVTGSARGFYLEEDVLFKSEECEYKDNIRAISANDYTLSGPFYNNSRWQLTGNDFLAISSPIPFANNSGVYNEMLSLGISDYVYITINNSDKIQIGKESTNLNYFNGVDYTGIWCHSSDELIVENNNFHFVNIGVEATLSELTIGGTSTIFANEFTGYYGILTENSYQEIGYNNFNLTAVEIKNPNTNLNGTLESLNMYWNDAELTDFEIYFTGTGAIVSDMLVNNNKFRNSRLNLTNIETNSVSNGLLVEDNKFGWCKHEYNAYNVKLVNTPGIRFGDNEFIIMNVAGPSSCPIASPPIRSRGMLAYDVPDAQFKKNTFEHCQLGFYGEGDFTNTIFSCNWFVQNDTGMYFFDALLTDQGDEYDPNIPGSTTEVVANTWSNCNIYNLVIEESGLFQGLTSKYYCEGPNNGYYWFNNPRHLSPTNTNGFITIGTFNFSWDVNDVFNGINHVPFVNDCSVLNKTVIHNTIKEENLVIYPNPTNGLVHFEINEEVSEHTFLRVYSFTGDLVHEQMILNKQNSMDLQVANGAYFLVLFNGQSVSKASFIVNKQ